MKMIIIRVCKDIETNKIIIATSRSFYKKLDNYGILFCKAYRFKDENELEEFINYCIDKYSKENVIILE